MWYDWQEDETFEECATRRQRACPRLTAAQLEALWQLRITTWDGYLISKAGRDELCQRGLVTRLNGWQVITREGLAVLDVYGLLKDDRYGTRGKAGDSLWMLKPADFVRLRREGFIV